MRHLANIGLLCASVIVSLGVMELAYRATRSVNLLVQWPNFAAENRAQVREAVQRYQYDETLGFIPVPDQMFSRMATTSRPGSDAQTPIQPKDAAAPILATGDSFTYGADVAANETWPAYLQTILRIPTINAGMNGFGLDQSVLFTERLDALYHPRVTILSFIGDDVRRAELRRAWNIEKPFFDVVDGKLALRNVPVPTGADANRLSTSQKLVGWSAIAARLSPYLEDVQEEPYGRRQRATAKGTGARVACLLMQRLAAKGLKVLIVAQYDPRHWRGPSKAQEDEQLTQGVLECARNAGLKTLDTFSVVDAAVSARGADAVFGRGRSHHNAEGNLIVAKAIAAELEKQGIDANSK